MNSTANASSEFWNCSTLFSSKALIGGTVALCLITVVSLARNSLIVMLVYKTPNLRKPINYFITKMASSDLLCILFTCPLLLAIKVVHIMVYRWPLWPGFVKLNTFFPVVSAVVSFQNLMLITVDRFGAVVFPFRSPLIRSKLCPFFIVATWMVPVAFSRHTCSPWNWFKTQEECSVIVTVPSPNIWLPLTVLSTRLSASLLVAITCLVSKDS